MTSMSWTNLLVLGRADPRGHEDGKVPGLRVDAVDDGAPAGADVVHVAIEVEDPAERLLHRADVVAERGRQMIGLVMLRRSKTWPVDEVSLVASELVADEQLIDEPLKLATVQLDEIAPPLLEFEIARAVGVGRPCKPGTACPTRSSPGFRLSKL